jgi:alkylated DNA repair protein alkB family protein 8
MGNKAGKPARDDTARASSSASALAAEDAHAAGAAADAAAASSSDLPTHEPVPGLRVVLDVLSEAQHDRVVSWLLKTLEQGRAGALRGDTYAPIPDKWQKRNQSREMLQFGTYTHSNRVESFRDVAPMPPELQTVVACLQRAGVYDSTENENALPTSCTVNFYEKGQWIPPHIDNPAFDRPVVTVSLRSTQRMTLGRGAVFEETKRATKKRKRLKETQKSLVTVVLPKRSAVVLRGAAADEYEHAIPPVLEPRVSLTFRALGDEKSPATKKRVARADAIRAQYRAERCKIREVNVRRGFGLVGPKGAVGRVGPLPEEVAAAEARRRAREGAVAAKREKKYSHAANPSDAGGVCRASDATSNVLSVSKSRAKKEAKKAAKAVAKRERREADARGPGASRALADDALEDENAGLEGKRETLRAAPKSPKSFARSADGVTCVERRGKTRSCPPCPPELLESSSTVSANGGGDAKDATTAQSRSERTSTKVIPRVELENVQRVYDAVAKQWHGTRYRAWSGVEDFVNRMNLRGALVADVGCGNGKNAPAVVRFGQTRGGAEVIGCDFSIPLLEICATERGDERVEAFAADAASLPMRSSCFDAALNIAVLHHASTSFRRRALVSETMRLLRVGGVALFYAWALEQETGGVSGHRFESQDVLVPFHKRAETVGKKKKEKSPLGGCGGWRPRPRPRRSVAREKTKKSLRGLGVARVFQRYCHVYKEGELESLFDHLREWCRVDRVYYDCGNWCAEVTRVK